MQGEQGKTSQSTSWTAKKPRNSTSLQKSTTKISPVIGAYRRKVFNNIPPTQSEGPTSAPETKTNSLNSSKTTWQTIQATTEPKEDFLGAHRTKQPSLISAEPSSAPAPNINTSNSPQTYALGKPIVDAYNLGQSYVDNGKKLPWNMVKEHNSDGAAHKILTAFYIITHEGSIAVHRSAAKNILGTEDPYDVCGKAMLSNVYIGDKDKIGKTIELIQDIDPSDIMALGSMTEKETTKHISKQWLNNHAKAKEIFDSLKGNAKGEVSYKGEGDNKEVVKGLHCERLLNSLSTSEVQNEIDASDSDKVKEIFENLINENCGAEKKKLAIEQYAAIAEHSLERLFENYGNIVYDLHPSDILKRSEYTRDISLLQDVMQITSDPDTGKSIKGWFEDKKDRYEAFIQWALALSGYMSNSIMLGSNNIDTLNFLLDLQELAKPCSKYVEAKPGLSKAEKNIYEHNLTKRGLSPPMDNFSDQYFQDMGTEITNAETFLGKYKDDEHAKNGLTRLKKHLEAAKKLKK